MILFINDVESETFKTYEVASKKSPVPCIYSVGSNKKLSSLFGVTSLPSLRAIYPDGLKKYFLNDEFNVENIQQFAKDLTD